ncbi:DEAD/DEAH box helicase [Aspergillus candidus]|uniref:ATP-dependent RNA helicase n=1 Tax=Aspergillus candidus TaxID=41067 RepID=A0A2I2F4S7_ASPCN|nr:putative ATP-dependent RNA helicase mss116, mitochondrial [Aspergillus candidus]PLB35643.1 putative ATP-dependent RNA helicase mss116, mitochondrial [Aspergillus candidus]
MLGAFRRFGVAHAVRAASPQAQSVRSLPQRVQWRSPSIVAIPRIACSSFHSSSTFLSAAAEAQAQPDVLDPAVPSRLTHFSQLAEKGLVDPEIVRTINQRMKIETMTDVQSLTIQDILQGGDVLAHAKTGTGKTLGFLLPVMQRLMEDPSVARSPRGAMRSRSRNSPVDIRSIIISPTRELAEQIAAEATKLAFGTGLKVKTAVGGTQKRAGLRDIQYNGCHLLVGTPGRLQDILSDPSSGITVPKLSTLVLDEADRLLDQGFAEELLKIQQLLPDPSQVDRQTLLFSATVPREVMTMVRRTMKPSFKFIKTVREDEVPTHLKVPQKVVHLDSYVHELPALLELIKTDMARARADPTAMPFKAIVYFNTTAQVNLACEVFNHLSVDAEGFGPHPLGRMPIYEIHSRLTQGKRSSVANSFRADKEAILFSSDVTARGMDFPNVTHVLQMGAPRDAETYVHRLGRTGRADKAGEGWVFLHHGERGPFTNKTQGLPITKDRSLVAPTLEVDLMEAESENADNEARNVGLESMRQVRQAMSRVDLQLRSSAWRAHNAVLGGSFPSVRARITAMEELGRHGHLFKSLPRFEDSGSRGSRGERGGNRRSRDDSSARGGLSRTFGGNSRMNGSRYDSGSNERSYGRSQRPSGSRFDQRSSRYDY